MMRPLLPDPMTPIEPTLGVPLQAMARPHDCPPVAGVVLVPGGLFPRTESLPVFLTPILGVPTLILGRKDPNRLLRQTPRIQRSQDTKTPGEEPARYFEAVSAPNLRTAVGLLDRFDPLALTIRQAAKTSPRLLLPAPPPPSAPTNRGRLGHQDNRL